MTLPKGIVCVVVNDICIYRKIESHRELVG